MTRALLITSGILGFILGTSLMLVHYAMRSTETLTERNARLGRHDKPFRRGHLVSVAS